MSESEKPTSEEIKEVYAHFGLAYYESEVLHRGLCNYYALDPFESQENVSRMRIEERLDLAWSTTLGQMVEQLKKTSLSEAIIERLERAAERRNRLAHDFWFDNAPKLFSKSGVRELIEQLREAAKLFHSLDEEISERTRLAARRLGVSKEIYEEALNDVLSGEDQVPLHDQRRPHKQERVVSAYAVPHSKGHQLIFETQDGEFWQVSDIGLAWTTHEEVSDEWEEIEKLNSHLPATIDPRPPVDDPYSYSFKLADNAVFRIEKRADGKMWKIEETE